MDPLVLLGDEAIAQGAIDAGLTGIYAYPGTPSTEITEYVIRSQEAQQKGIKACWCANEKTAMEAAMGVSYAGKRGMACMKHVGLNVAADPFMNSAITGANGGLIVVSADDPSMHSSQNEQDSRYYGKFAMIPILEPSNQQEAYDMVLDGFEISERLGIPVLLRITTRLAHSRAIIRRRMVPVEQNSLKVPEDLHQYILIPAFARKRYKALLNNQAGVIRESEESRFNQYFDGSDTSLGVITAGIGYNYLMENFSGGVCPYPILKIGQYPMPRHLVEKIYKTCDQLLIVEEGYPFIEELVRGYLNHGKKIMGRMDGTFQREGELNPNKVAAALGKPVFNGLPVPPVIVPRPPSLCKGCPHIYSFEALNEALAPFSKGRVFSDIGCYALAALFPLDAINTCVDMGASITMAKGAADAGLIPSVAVLGDSTFTHSGITGLLDAVNDRSAITVIILDNLTVAMTGGQPSSAFGKIESICEGIGVEKDHMHVINPVPKNHKQNLGIFRHELAYKGVSVIVPRRECLQTTAKKIRNKKREQLINQEQS